MGYAGGCLCGAIRYWVSGEPISVTHCYCEMCRRASGAAFLTWVGFSTKLVRFDAAAPSTYRSSANAVRGFCATCGSTLTMQYHASPHVLDLALGTLDEPASVAVTQHIWCVEALPWAMLRDGLPHYLRAAGSSLAD